MPAAVCTHNAIGIITPLCYVMCWHIAMDRIAEAVVAFVHWCPRVNQEAACGIVS